MRTRLLLATTLLFACHGPSSSPDGSVKAFYAAASSEDWGAMVNLLTKASRDKLGSQERAERYFKEQFTNWKKVEVDIDDWSVGADKKTATVRFNCVAEVLDRYKVIGVDCSDTFSLLKQDDGWHINLPAAQRLRVQ